MADAEPSQHEATTRAAAVLERDEDRQAERARTRTPVVFPDELLPGVGGEEMSLRDGLRRGGVAMFVVLTLLNSLDELEGAAINVLAPEIRATFGISEGAIVFISTASAAFFVLGAVPMGWLCDRVRRRIPLVGISGLFFGVFVFLSGVATSAFMLFWTRFGTGVAKASTIPVHGSLIADAYPIGVRARMAALNDFIGHGLALASPVLVGAIAAGVGGDEGWRWAWYLLGIPVSIAALFAFFLREPQRGRWEKDHVLGEVLADDEGHSIAISTEAAFARIRSIRTIRSVIVAFCALGFGLFSQQVLATLYLDDTLGVTDVLDRGIVLSSIGLLALPVLPFVGRAFDATYRRDPARALALVGALVLPSALLTPLQYSTSSTALFVALGVPQAVLTTAAFAMVRPVLQAVVPYRLRGMGTAYGTIYIFFIGGFGGGVLSGFLTDSIGVRGTVITLGVPSAIVGGLLLINGARFIRDDLALVVEELLEEREEVRRRGEQGLATPALQLANVDFSYGSVQVLFGIDLEVRQGETLALLGTNGAGKSTILRVVSGLATPERGVVRFRGQNITYVSPESRAKQLGIMLLPGGHGVFGHLTVEQNLRVAARLRASNRREVAERVERVLALFPELEPRRGQVASKLSGGQQQMVALARVLVHEPEVLLIDELSLGLAPAIVERLLTLVEDLKARGQTMVIVEQSLNVALAVADRAIFLEKGEVRFEGPAQELLERDDLARAVFFGNEPR